MVTFFKDFNYSAELAKMKSRFNNSLYKYGLVGEERVAYQLKKCRLDILCAYNIRLNIDGNKCQFDFIGLPNVGQCHGRHIKSRSQRCTHIDNSVQKRGAQIPYHLIQAQHVLRGIFLKKRIRKPLHFRGHKTMAPIV